MHNISSGCFALSEVFSVFYKQCRNVVIDFYKDIKTSAFNLWKEFMVVSNAESAAGNTSKHLALLCLLSLWNMGSSLPATDSRS